MNDLKHELDAIYASLERINQLLNGLPEQQPEHHSNQPQGYGVPTPQPVKLPNARFRNMAKKELRDYVRKRNRRQRAIASGNAPRNHMNVNYVEQQRLESFLALAELRKRGSTFEDVQLGHSVVTAYHRAYAAVSDMPVRDE